MLRIIKKHIYFALSVIIFIGSTRLFSYAKTRHPRLLRSIKPNLGRTPKITDRDVNRQQSLYPAKHRKGVSNADTVVEVADNSLYLQNCSSSFGMDGKAHSDIKMREVYESFLFNDTKEFGDWQANWNITVNTSRFTEQKKLNVFLVPHSHDDAGWILTFEQYYKSSVQKILDLVLEKLDQNPSMKFIQVEIAFFSLWWDEISTESRIRLKTIVERKQLEFVTGGWVMADEANSHYYSLLIQLFEGNQWLKQHLDYTPRNGWSIDPFGQSPTMAYILKRSGFKNMVIQRTHYLIKKYLGDKEKLEFYWRQSWDKSGSTDILTHMMPFNSYGTPSTCGPSQGVCWSVPYDSEIDKNVGDISEPLVDQYKKKAMLFKTNNILVPLGNDFTWNSGVEWDGSMSNFEKIMEYVNNKVPLHTQVWFGTLDEYFQAMRSEGLSNKLHLPSLSGDFYTYSLGDDHYWSGYFTSRPFHKALDRILISYLKAAHMAYAFTTAELFKRSGNISLFPFIKTLFTKLRHARRSLSVFQHHDAITGTSKDAVMEDYAEKLTVAINGCDYVMQQSIQILSHINTLRVDKLKNLNNSDLGPFPIKFESMTSNSVNYSLPEAKTIVLNSFSPQAVVTVYNPIAQIRTTLVTVNVQIPEDVHSFQVTNLREQLIDSELMPVFTSNNSISRNIFQLNFVANLDAMSISSFILRIWYFPSLKEGIKPTVTFVAEKNTHIDLNHPRFDISQSNTPLSISNGLIRLHFDTNGFVDSVEINGETHKLKIRLFKYGSDGSGLYLFIPNGPAQLLEIINKPTIRIVVGKFQSYIEILLPLIEHKIILYNYKGTDKNTIEIRNQIDLRGESDLELMMRFESNITSGKISYTDLNAFQMIQRSRIESMPIGGNYYPMPSATFIEDSNLRMTVLGSHAFGTASLESGTIDVVMDRTLSQDDNLGVGQGSGEPIKNTNIFKLLIESPNCDDEELSEKAPMLSLNANMIKNELLHSVHIFRGLPTELGMNFTDDPLNRISDYLPSVSTRIPCDVEVVDAIPFANFPDYLDDLNYTPTPEAGLLVHRVGFDSRFVSDSSLKQCGSGDANFGVFSLNDVFNNLLQTNATLMTLTFLKNLTVVNTIEEIFLDPMEIYAVHLKYKI